MSAVSEIFWEYRTLVYFSENVLSLEDMENKHFFKFLQSRLRNQNLTALAKELEIPKTLVHDWVQARRAPSLKNIHHVKKIASYLGVSLEYILTGESEEGEVITSISFEDEGRKYQVVISKKGE